MSGKSYLNGYAALFVSIRYPQLDLVLNPDALRANGGPAKPIFKSFHPGPAGGELRVMDQELVDLLRKRDKMSDHYREITSDEDYSQAIIARDKFVVDDGSNERVVRGGVKKVEAAASEPEPESSPAPAPKAARGPGRKA